MQASFSTTAPDTVTVTYGVIGGVGGTIAPAYGAVAYTAAGSSITLIRNESMAFTITPAANYRIKQLLGNGSDVTDELSGNTYSLTDVTQEATLSVEFEKVYTLTFTAGTCGSVSAAYADDMAITSGDEVLAGTSVSLTATPYAGYAFKQWTVSPDSLTFSGTGGTVTFTMPESAVNATASFKVSSSGGGGGDGSSGGGGKTVFTVPASSNSATQQVPYTMDNTKASVTLDDETMQDLLEKSTTTGITVDVSGVSNCSGIECELDSKWLAEDGKITSITFVGPGNVRVSRAMLENFGVDGSKKVLITVFLGSITISLQIDGETVTGYDPANPARVVYPYAEDMGSTTVIYDTSSGKVLPFCVSDGEKNMLFLAPYFATFEAEENTKTFTDVSGHWAEDDIAFTAARELFNGIGGGLFGPDETMTRAMVVTVLGRMWGVDTDDYTGSSFADVDPGEWYGPYVQWASESGIVYGMGDNQFDPERPVTREQLSTILSRFIDYSGLELTLTDSDISFVDSSDISSWAAESVESIKNAGIIVGKPGNLFDPQGLATRAEVSAIFRRFIENVVK